MLILLLITLPLNIVMGMWLATQLGLGPSNLQEYRRALGLALKEEKSEEPNDEGEAKATTATST